MHPTLKAIESELHEIDDELRYRFALQCVEDVAANLEEEIAITALQKFRALLNSFHSSTMSEMKELTENLKRIAQSHPGSKSIDGTRHAAVSATYALSKATEGHALEAAAYAAYSSVYGYGGYAVNDPDSFAIEHQKQLDQLLLLKSRK